MLEDGSQNEEQGEPLVKASPDFLKTPMRSLTMIEWEEDKKEAAATKRKTEKKAVNASQENKETGHPSGTNKKCDKKYLLHLYLHSLFEIDLQAGKEFHDLQVELYEEYEPKMILPFLGSSQHIRLDKVKGQTAIINDYRIDAMTSSRLPMS
ncbi:hypothetical protein OPV22_018081 [Ensete ventricosum]|uniref:Uncharacterized protein n=1 Tax=Ensete ventricosum TaxID=4639 RepID=A0AAV8QUP8_ENSVE|nr:hypothetical protein OPV22_018081 [Ensete ventricosum]